MISMKFFIICLMCLSSLVTAQEESFSSGVDPRCPADFDRSKCPTFAFAHGLMDYTRAIDPTSCTKLDDCPKCFVGDEWETRLKSLGLGTVTRSLAPWVLALNWLSHEFITTLTMILLREALGFDARGAPSANQGNTDFICCGDDEVMIDMERWLNGDFYSEEGYFTVYTSPVGYTGTSGLFIPSYTLEKYPMANAYNAYKYLPEYGNIFPRAMSTNCSDMLQVKSAENIANCNTATSAFVCDANPWTDTQCVAGHYVPPQCEGANAAYCQELYMTDPYYDTAMFEAMIKNNKLNFTGAYIGATDYPDFIKSKYAAREDFFFYWYAPDPLAAAVGARAVNFDPVTPECTKVRTSDPTTSEAACGYPVTTLLKYVRRDVLKRDVDFKFFFESFSITEGTINQLLAGHTSGSGNQSVYDLSCSWLKDNYATWSPWIRHTQQTSGLADRATETQNLVVILIPIVVCFTVVLVIVGSMFIRRRMANRHAPKTGPLAILFTDVESSTTLWELCGSDMKLAMKIHNEVIRKLIIEYQTYEVKTNGDSFMIACKSLTDATLLALAIQTSLNDRGDFPTSITDTYDSLHANDDARNVVASKLQTGTYTTQGDKEISAELPGGGKSMPIGLHSHLQSDVIGHDAEIGSGEINSVKKQDPSQRALNANGSLAPSSERRVWNGLRVRIGLHWCSEVSPQLDAITQRYDYFGHDVNVSARVEGYASGGEILIQEDTFLHLTRSEEFQVLVSPDCLITQVAKAAELKGVQGKVGLWSLVPLSLRGRVFKPLSGVELPDAQGEDDLWDQPSGGEGGYSSSVSHKNIHSGILSRHGSYHSQMSKVSASAGVSQGQQQPQGQHGHGVTAVRNEVTQAIRFAIQSANQVFLSDADRSRWLFAMADKYRVPKQKNAGRLAKLVQSAVVSQYLAMHQPSSTQMLNAPRKHSQTHSLQQPQMATSAHHKDNLNSNPHQVAAAGWGNNSLITNTIGNNSPTIATSGQTDFSISGAVSRTPGAASEYPYQINVPQHNYIENLSIGS